MFTLRSLHTLAGRLLPPALGELGEAPGVGLGRFPACFSWFGVEVRLGDGDDAVDLAVALDPSPLARVVLLEALPGLLADLPPAWGPTLARVGAWARADAPPLARAPTLWLEVDRGREATPPILFVTALGLGAADARAIAELVVDAPREAALAERTRRIVHALAERGVVHHLADLRPRGLDAIRVVGSVARRHLDPLLDALGWRPDPGALADLCAALGELGDPLTIDLDVAASGRRRLGVECHLPTDPDRDPRWRAILAHAGRTAGAAPARLAALTGWPQRHVLGGILVVHRYLHLKFTLSDGAAPAVKAYLGVRPALTRP